MTKTTLALAAALIAGTTLSSAANAGGVRLGFGFPLGSFVAKPYQSSSLGGGYGYGKKKCDKPQLAARRAAQRDYAEARKAKRSAPKVELAESARTRKVEKEVVIQTAAVATKTSTVDAPAVIVPESPAAQTNNVQGTQSTPTPAPVTTAAVTPETTTPEVKVDESKVEKIEKTASEPATRKVEISAEGKRICRKFSAIIGSLVDIPCE